MDTRNNKMPPIKNTNKNDFILENNTQEKKMENKTANKGAMIASLFSVGVLLGTILLLLGIRLKKMPLLPGTGITTQQLNLSTKEIPENADGLPTTEIVTKIAPSIVSVEIYVAGSRKVKSTGSGIIVTKDGLITTNAHVIEDASAIRVILHNGKGYTARLVGQSDRHDLAILQIQANNLEPAEFGDSDKVQVGQKAIAMGNAAGILPGSPTQGIISGVNRQVPMEIGDHYVTMTLLQTDAAINPGNSGGALVNVYGQVIGINIAKLQSMEIDNIGFAIPSNEALPVIQILINSGTVTPAASLGVSVWALNETLGPEFGLPNQGLVIETLTKESDLNKFSVSEGDVILSIDDIPMKHISDLSTYLETHKPEETIKLILYKAETGETVLIEPILKEAK